MRLSVAMTNYRKYYQNTRSKETTLRISLRKTIYFTNELQDNNIGIVLENKNIEKLDSH